MDYKRVKEELDRLSKDLKNPTTQSVKDSSFSKYDLNFSNVLRTIFNIKEDDEKSTFQKWNCSTYNVHKSITFGGDRNIYPIFGEEEWCCSFSDLNNNFIHPFGSSWFLNPTINPPTLRIRGYVLFGNENILETIYGYKLLIDSENPYVNTGKISPMTNTILELNFGITKIIDDNTLQLSSLDSNTLVFTDNKKSTTWKRKK